MAGDGAVPEGHGGGFDSTTPGRSGVQDRTTAAARRFPNRTRRERTRTPSTAQPVPRGRPARRPGGGCA